MVKKVHTSLNLADLLTKPLHPLPYMYAALRKGLMNLVVRSLSCPTSRRSSKKALTQA